MGFLKLSDRYSKKMLEEACRTALELSVTPSLKSIRNIILTLKSHEVQPEEQQTPPSAVVRGADYYGREAE